MSKTNDTSTKVEAHAEQGKSVPELTADELAQITGGNCYTCNTMMNIVDGIRTMYNLSPLEGPDCGCGRERD